ncbi:hypothetical protein QWY31_00810 [Cytophagales bacterium LB-30]|uniref:Uncharacterized protein n=1 Tax=Shiella aurantiaca TaxID=3058365 RepID=A0ABT8F0P5_9BACT|nr:hypothetical protein [Shiella aurantiaca]MDN4164017.1 hypothetical protein [Shiella aurantiaca]
MEIVQKYWFLVVLLLPLLGLGIYLEIRKSKERVALRIVLWFLALLALFFLVLGETQKDTNRYSVVLLTQNKEELSDDTAWLSEHPQTEIFTEQELMEQVYVAEQEANTLQIDTLFVPINQVDFWQEKLPKSRIFPANNISILGSYQIINQALSTVNEKYCFSIRFLKIQTPFWLYYQGWDMDKDSVFVDSAEKELDFCEVPKVPGRYVGKLWAKTDKSLEVMLPEIPLNVLDKKYLSILILSSYPSAEWRYLRDFWRSQGHSVRMQTGIALGKTLQTQGFVRDGLNSLLGEENKGKVDALVMEEAYFSSLSKTLQSRILNSVNQAFIRLLLFPSKGEFTRLLGSSTFALKARTTSPTYLFSWKGLAQSVELMPFTFTENWQRGASPFEELIAAQSYGKGWVLSQLAVATYPWLLAGKDELYEAYWSAVANWLNPESETAIFRMDQDWPMLKQTIGGELMGYTDIGKIQFLYEDIVRYFHTQTDPFIPEKQVLNFSLSQSGWWTPLVENDTLWASSFYVQKQEGFPGFKQSNRSDFSILQSEQGSDKVTGKGSLLSTFDWSRYRFVFVFSFIILLALLWLLPRI